MALTLSLWYHSSGFEPGWVTSSFFIFFLESTNPTKRQPAAWGIIGCDSRCHSDAQWFPLPLTKCAPSAVMDVWVMIVCDDTQPSILMCIQVYEIDTHTFGGRIIQSDVQRHCHTKRLRVKMERPIKLCVGQYYHGPLSALSFPRHSRQDTIIQYMVHKAYGNTNLQSRISFATYLCPVSS